MTPDLVISQLDITSNVLSRVFPAGVLRAVETLVLRIPLNDSAQALTLLQRSSGQRNHGAPDIGNLWATHGHHSRSSGKNASTRRHRMSVVSCAAGRAVCVARPAPGPSCSTGSPHSAVDTATTSGSPRWRPFIGTDYSRRDGSGAEAGGSLAMSRGCAHSSVCEDSRMISSGWNTSCRRPGSATPSISLIRASAPEQPIS